VNTADDGSAVVDTVLVTVFLMTMVVGVLQLGLALHVRNTLSAAASEGARFAANADQGAGSGEARARRVIVESLPDRYANDVSELRTRRDGLDVVVVEVRAPLPLVGPWGPAGLVTVRGQALAEGAS
jgi:hypothetical protein